MVQRSKCPRLTPETRNAIGIGEKMPRQDLERDHAVEFAISREIDFGHSTRAQQFLDLVCSDFLADERGDGCEFLGQRASSHRHRRAFHKLGGPRLRVEKTQHLLVDDGVALGGFGDKALAFLGGCSNAASNSASTCFQSWGSID